MRACKKGKEKNKHKSSDDNIVKKKNNTQTHTSVSCFAGCMPV